MTIDTMGPILPGLADDAAALLGHLGVDRSDVVGYSMGGGGGLQLALRHPDLVRKLVVASASYTSDRMHAVVHRFAGTPGVSTPDRVRPTTDPVTG